MRAAVLTLLLAGSLYPTVARFNVAVLAAIIAVPLVIWEIQLCAPRLHPSLVFVAPIFVALALPGLLDTPNTDYGREKFSNLVSITLLSMLAAVLIRDHRGLVAFARMWAASGLVMAASALTGDRVAGRAVGLDEANPIWLARAVGSALVVVAWLGLQQYVRRWVAGPAALVMILGLLATGSRGPLSAAVVGCVFVVVATSGRRNVRIAGVAVSGVLVATALLVWQPPEDSRFAGLINPSDGFRDSGRTSLLDATWPLLPEHPWGIGYGNWSSFTGIAFVRYPHDLWLEVAVEAGWLSAAVVVASTALVIVRLWRARGPQASLVLGLLMAEVIAVSVSGDVNARTFWAMLSLGWLTPYLAASRRSTQPATHGRPGRPRVLALKP